MTWIHNIVYYNYFVIRHKNSLHDFMMLILQKYLLLLDNAPTHSISESINLTNVRVHFLPPNTTAFLQPCDAGIINSFKANYKKKLAIMKKKGMAKNLKIFRLNMQLNIQQKLGKKLQVKL